MSRLDNTWHPFVVLNASPSDVKARSLDSVLETSGYAVLRARTGADAIRIACTALPDAVILDAHAPDMPGLEVCRRIHGDARFPATTPIFVTTADGNTRAQRLEAYSAGAWDVCSQPLDGAVLLLKLQTFLRAKVVGERWREGGLVDDLTGLYTREGLERRAREIGAAAARQQEALACIAFAPAGGDARADGHGRDFVTRHVAEIARRNLRTSDVLGCLGDSAFGVIAPATDLDAARAMMERIQRLLDTPTDLPAAGNALTLRVGYCASANFGESTSTAAEMLADAAGALRPPPTPGAGGAYRLHGPRGHEAPPL